MRRPVFLDTSYLIASLNLYKARNDKAWGMIDCFSFVTMEEKQVKRALTFDEHFRQAGFEVPLLD